jgi:hypothetical protein
MNAYRADGVYLFDHTIQLEKLWMDFEEISYGGYTKSYFIISYNGNTSTVDTQTHEVGVTLVPLAVWF